MKPHLLGVHDWGWRGAVTQTQTGGGAYGMSAMTHKVQQMEKRRFIVSTYTVQTPKRLHNEPSRGPRPAA